MATVRALVADLARPANGNGNGHAQPTASGPLAIAADRVRHVVAAPRLTPVPLAPPVVLGLANVRGEVVPVLDTPLLLDAGGQGLGEAPFAILVMTDRGPAALAIPAMPIAIEVEAADLVDPDALVAP
jgi:purine-binding chemotaxis protein CheW